MFNYISGEVVELNSGIAVVDVGGIGYELSVSDYTAAECEVGETRRFYTYLQVKEDGIALFGFAESAEKNMFLNLISVSGVGCKVAQSILSGMDCGSLAAAISIADIKSLCKIKGLGKKTAERIVLELKDKVLEPGTSAMPLVDGRSAPTVSKDMLDAVAVLCSLGKSQAEAERLVEAASKLGAVTAKELVNMSFRIN